jgi:hypothetical protein
MDFSTFSVIYHVWKLVLKTVKNRASTGQNNISLILHSSFILEFLDYRSTMCDKLTIVNNHIRRYVPENCCSYNYDDILHHSALVRKKNTLKILIRFISYVLTSRLPQSDTNSIFNPAPPPPPLRNLMSLLPKKLRNKKYPGRVVKSWSRE